MLRLNIEKIGVEDGFLELGEAPRNLNLCLPLRPHNKAPVLLSRYRYHSQDRPTGFCTDCPTSRVLDLGCGSGDATEELALYYEAVVVGIDLDFELLRRAQQSHPQHQFFQCTAEALPFSSKKFSHVDSGVAVPYMDIRKVFSEVHRVLAPGGTFRFSVHNWRFVVHEFRSARSMVALAYRSYVFVNGLLFHFLGKQFKFLWTKRIESFQTSFRMRRELYRVGFCDFQEGNQSPPTFWAKRPLE